MNKNLQSARKNKNDEFIKIKDHPRYSISKSGIVCNDKTGKVLKNIKLKTGYLRVTLSSRKQVLVHRLVAEAFIPNPYNLPCVNHIDENPENNNNYGNLEWVTHKQNIRHSCKGCKSYLFNKKEYYETNSCTRSDFKRICNRHVWNIVDFTELDSGEKRYSNKKYYYIERGPQ